MDIRRICFCSAEHAFGPRRNGRFDSICRDLGQDPQGRGSVELGPHLRVFGSESTCQLQHVLCWQQKAGISLASSATGTTPACAASMAATTSQGGSCLRVGSFDSFLLHDDAGGATTEKSFCRGRIQAMEDLRRSEAASTWQLFCSKAASCSKHWPPSRASVGSPRAAGARDGGPAAWNAPKFKSCGSSSSVPCGLCSIFRLVEA